MIKVKIKVLKTIMKANNLNQAKLAKVVGVDQGLISKILKNNIAVGGKFILGLLEYTNMKFKDLFILSANAPEMPQDRSSIIRKERIPVGLKEEEKV